MGVAESAPKGASQSILGGVVMRADLIIDGMILGKVRIGGMNATEAIIRMVESIDREDIGGLLLHGSVIAGYNIIDLPHLYRKTKLPVISVTKEVEEELKKHLMATFPEGWEERWKVACRNGSMHLLTLATGSTVHIQFIGMNWNQVKPLINRFTRFGGLPEPIRVARLFARAVSAKRGSS